MAIGVIVRQRGACPVLFLPLRHAAVSLVKGRSRASEGRMPAEPSAAATSRGVLLRRASIPVAGHLLYSESVPAAAELRGGRPRRGVRGAHRIAATQGGTTRDHATFPAA
jgi:hypothetical protein